MWIRKCFFFVCLKSHFPDEILLFFVVVVFVVFLVIVSESQSQSCNGHKCDVITTSNLQWRMKQQKQQNKLSRLLYFILFLYLLFAYIYSTQLNSYNTLQCASTLMLLLPHHRKHHHRHRHHHHYHQKNSNSLSQCHPQQLARNNTSCLSFVSWLSFRKHTFIGIKLYTYSIFVRRAKNRVKYAVYTVVCLLIFLYRRKKKKNE